MKKNSALAAMLLPVFAIAFFDSCKKDDPTPATRAEMLSGTWSTTEVGVDSNGNGTWDAAEHRPAAGSPNAVKITFNSNGTGTATYAVFATPFPITWNLQNNDNDLRLISNMLGTADTTIENIISFSNTDAIVRDQSYSPARYMALNKQ